MRTDTMATTACRIEALEARRLLSASPSSPNLDAAGLAGTIEQGMTGPLEIQRFERVGNRLMAVGEIDLPGGTDLPFSTPVSVQQVAQTGSTEVLRLTLGPLDLNLLGLEVDLDRVELLVTAQRGRGLILGNVLSDFLARGDSLGGLSTGLNTLFDGGESAVGASPTSSRLDEVVDSLNLAGLGNLTGGSTAQQTSADRLNVLDLSIQDLEIGLLGLRVETLAPIRLRVDAVRGPGNLLGNVFYQLSGLLDFVLPANFPAAGATGGSGSGGSSGGGSSGGSGGSGGSGSGSANLPDDAVEVISVVVQDLNLDLLGLRADLTVDLVVALDPGPGNLVANLLVNRLAQITEEADLQMFLTSLDGLLGNFGGTGSSGGSSGGGTIGGVGGGGSSLPGGALPFAAGTPVASLVGDATGGATGGGSVGSSGPQRERHGVGSGRGGRCRPSSRSST